MLLNWFKTFFSSIFKRLNAKQRTEAQTASHVAVSSEQQKSHPNELLIPFYPKLIDHLELDHQNLLNLYIGVGDSLSQKEFQVIPEQLSTFKLDFKAHLDVENIKFYGFLEQRLKGHNELFASLRRFRKEMRSIERTVIKFLDYWMDFGVDRASAATFKAEYNAIGAALVKRIESEEKELYTMYVV